RQRVCSIRGCATWGLPTGDFTSAKLTDSVVCERVNEMTSGQILIASLCGVSPRHGTGAEFRHPDCPEMLEISPWRFVMGVPRGEEEPLEGPSAAYFFSRSQLPNNGNPI